MQNFLIKLVNIYGISRILDEFLNIYDEHHVLNSRRYVMNISNHVLNS